MHTSMHCCLLAISLQQLHVRAHCVLIEIVDNHAAPAEGTSTRMPLMILVDDEPRAALLQPVNGGLEGAGE